MAQQYQVEIVTKVAGASKIAALDAAIKQLAKNQNLVKSRSEQVAQSLKKLRVAADKVAVSKTKMAVATARAGKGLASVQRALIGLAATYVSITAAVALFNNSIAATGRRSAAEKQIQNLTDSTDEYEVALLAAEVASHRFGVSVTDASEAMASSLGRLKGLGFGLAEVNDIYTGFNVVAVESAASMEVASGAFLQLSQALGRGTLQGDEMTSIMERMPRLGIEIKNALGPEGAGKSIKDLGSEGKLTADVIYKALKGAAERADDLQGRLSEQQVTMDAARVAADKFFVSMGNAFAPIFLSVVKELTFAMNFMASLLEQSATWAAKNAEAIRTFTVVALRLGAAVGVIVAVVKAINLIRGAIAATTVAMKTLLAFAGPKGWGVLAAGAAIAAGATWGAVEANKALDKAFEDAMKKGKEQGEAAVEELQARIEQYRKLNDEQKKNKVNTDAIKKANDELNESLRTQKSINDSMINALDNQTRIMQATFNAETQVLGVRRQSAEAALALAKTDQERAKAIQELYEVSVAEAELVYEQTMATAKAEERKMQALMKNAELTLKVARYKAVEAEAAGTVNKAHYKAIQLAQETLNLATENYIAQQQITKEVQRGAAAVRDKTIAAAETLRQQQLQEMQQNRTNAAIGDGVNKMNQLATAASNAAAASQGIGAGGAGGGGKAPGSKYSFWHGDQTYDKYRVDENGMIVETTEAERRRQRNQAIVERGNAIANQEQIREFLNNFDYRRHLEHGWQMPNISGTRRASSDSTAFAEGGYVDSPTNALIGEAGEGEYVIPASKMSSAISRYSAGVRGEGVVSGGVTANVNYSGTTLNFDGDEYVKKSDVSGIVKRATAATGNAMRNSSKFRLETGI